MKKLFLLFSFFAFGFVSIAQIQITQSDVANLFAVGKSWQRFGVENPAIQMNVGTAGGTAQNWTVPAFTWTDTSIVENLLPSSTPYASIFPAATNAQYSTWIDGGNVSTSYEYYQITSNALYSLGRAIHYQSSQIDTTIITTDQQYILQLPLTYGATFGDTRDSTDLGGGSYIISTSSQTVDAFGTIALPWNSYGTLRVKTTDENAIYFGGILFSQSSETYFNWITKDGGIFEAAPDTGSGISGTVNLNSASLTKIINATSTENEITLPQDFVLDQNYPNPFNPATIIKYSIPFNTNVSIRVYDILGNEIAALVNENKNAGVFEVKFNGEGLSSGIYLYQLRAANFVETRKMTLIK